MMESKVKIMLVNGDEKICNSLYSLLLQRGYSVTALPNGREAVQKAKEYSFDILITEMKMPDMSGIEVIRKFKQIKSEICIIVLTAYGSVETAVEAMKEGAYDYITKPFNLNEVKLIVDRALERLKLLKAARDKEIYKELAILDGLTEVYNRRYFDRILAQELNRARRYNHQLSLLMVDIDDFKRYNDTYGHPVGDRVLKQIAKKLLESSRNIDFVTRYGGEEFAIVLPETDKTGASVAATRFLSLITLIKIDDPKSIFSGKITVSIGLASYPEDALTKEELISKADSALYQAKHLGKNRVCLFGIGEQ